jgi:uncharacterized membrane protein required for colicin V production
MGNISGLDLILIPFLLVTTFVCYKKGFIKIFLNLLKLFFSISITYYFKDHIYFYLSNYLNNKILIAIISIASLYFFSYTIISIVFNYITINLKPLIIFIYINKLLGAILGVIIGLLGISISIVFIMSYINNKDLAINSKFYPFTVQLYNYLNIKKSFSLDDFKVNKLNKEDLYNNINNQTQNFIK